MLHALKANQIRQRHVPVPQKTRARQPKPLKKEERLLLVGIGPFP